MKHLILGIILTGCGQPFEAQLFNESKTIDAGGYVDAGAAHDSIVETDSRVHDNDGANDSGRSIPESVLCCRREDNSACEQCAEFSNLGTCTLEGMRCIFHGSGFMDYQVCINSRWEWGEAFKCQ